MYNDKIMRTHRVGVGVSHAETFLVSKKTLSLYSFPGNIIYNPRKIKTGKSQYSKMSSQARADYL